ncbi:MAG: hypothetical protein O2955_09620 [Planctomycetota bacterium]|nr:hypothetical protein [Planctomycetota bacterium]MDA1212767.1 hypothetical protein [Planctomycetota bacterium]
MRYIITMVIALSVGLDTVTAAEPRDLVIAEYAPTAGTFSGCTHIFFRGEREIVTAGRRLHLRDRATEKFRDAPVMLFDDPHAVVYNPHDGLYYATDTGRHRMVAFRDFNLPRIEKETDTLAGVKLDRPHDVVIDNDGWIYVLNPNTPTVFRFRGFGEEESSLELSEHPGYSRALSIVDGKLYVVGSNAGKIIAIDDFAKQQYRVYTSFGKKRDAPAGSWSTTGLVPNDAEFYAGKWYVTSYFCPTYADGTDCNENKFIRFSSWDDFETGQWEDISDLLPKDIVPYYMTRHDDDLYLATFSHEGEGQPGRVYCVSGRKQESQ